MEEKPVDFGQEYSESGLWDKMRRYSRQAGSAFAELALTLYYTAADPNTPAWAKTVIVGALGYFIFPMDAVPDLVPGVGYVDDLGVLTAAVSTIAASVTKEHREKAKTKHREYFGD